MAGYTTGRILFDGGANVMHSTDCFGTNTVLKLSIQNGRTEMILILLDIGLVKKYLFYGSYLELACDVGHPPIVRSFLENGASANGCTT